MEGIIVISNDGIPIRTTLDPEITVQYASLVTRFTEKSKSVLGQVNGEVSGVKASRSLSFQNSLGPPHKAKMTIGSFSFRGFWWHLRGKAPSPPLPSHRREIEGNND